MCTFEKRIRISLKKLIIQITSNKNKLIQFIPFLLAQKLIHGQFSKFHEIRVKIINFISNNKAIWRNIPLDTHNQTTNIFFLLAIILSYGSATSNVYNRLVSQTLVHSGLRFQVKNRRGDRVYWKCSISNCPATIQAHINLPTKVEGGMQVRRENTERSTTDLKKLNRLHSQEISTVQFAYIALYLLHFD